MEELEVDVQDPCGASEMEDLVNKLYEEVVMRYLKMGVGEFLRDFRRDYHVKKTEAHRKVVERKNKRDLLSSKVCLDSLRVGTTPGQVHSHLCLQQMVSQHEDISEQCLQQG